MFPRLWERAIALFERVLLSAFEEGARRVDVAIAQRLETSIGSPNSPPPPPVPLIPQLPPLPPVKAPKAVAAPAQQAPVLPPLPPLPEPAVEQPADGQPPRRPRGRPKKEPQQ